ncbi:hypothetical protein Bra3105_06590 [Brachybacterium halotolerans subsp. kimchii]|uniref:hypothetical protein n=1 Tax=Brachybacterium halotolerans TaxID=2795215 RepID=UPI001E500747|nr:hypothetical protein [Brachybacterium halotolerans]UEJ83974.1 hypothetical protein Bra3105_06590 [Brachybacterium halotolerans subsp. kimchii]
MSTKPNYHHLTVTIAPLGDVHWSITCTAPEGAWCRVWCDEGCEHPSDPGHEGHVMKDQGTCGIAPWFDDSSLIPEMYEGIEQPLRSGPVSLHVSDDETSWEYVEDVAR